MNWFLQLSGDSILAALAILAALVVLTVLSYALAKHGYYDDHELKQPWPLKQITRKGRRTQTPTKHL